MKSITVSELLSLALLELASKEKDPAHCWLIEDPRILHPAIEDLTKRYRKSLSPLKRLRFSSAGAFVYSRELAQSFDLMQQSGIIRRENPSFDRFAPSWHDEDARSVLEEVKEDVFENDPEASKAFVSFAEELGKKLLPNSAA